ncbi:antibiotic biosynthesis monooxygenase family protein [Actinoallomurus sp. NPDC050550]|uniref:antibiotic biosynthesis monooxygenase family protein n=1 Tax=Actinoallomurus sp. NPDC050550 TaxID=3154937 RepID=UPI003411B9F4
MNVIPTADQSGVLALNVFTVRPEKQQELIDCILGAGDAADVPGLLSMHLLRSLDGTQVINFMHWTSEGELKRATASHPVVKATRERVGDLIERAAPNVYEVIPVA